MSAAVLNNFYHFILSLLQTKQRQREEKSLEATKELKTEKDFSSSRHAIVQLLFTVRQTSVKSTDSEKEEIA